jgi:hypothetical protein
MSTGHAPIKVGVTLVNFAAIGALFGESASGNPFQGYVDAFKYINAHGGVDGHKIEADYFEINGGTSAASADQAACTHFTQDDKVSLVFSDGLSLPGSSTFVSCLAQAGIPEIDSGQDDYLSASSYPNLFVPDGQSLAQQIGTMISGEAKLGFLTRKDHLGVLMENCSGYPQAYNDVVVPLAKRYGFSVSSFQINCYTGFSDLASVTAAIGGEVLKMKATGVTKVIDISASEGYATDTATKDASGQHYYPGWIISSGAFAEGNSAGSALSFAKNEEPNMRGLGIWSKLDVGVRARPNARQTAAQRLCKKLSPTLGDGSHYTGANQESVVEGFYGECDAVRVAQQMLELDGVNPNISLLVKVYPQAASMVGSAADVGGQLAISGGSRSGATEAQPFGYSAKCGCFALAGSPVAVS